MLKVISRSAFDLQTVLHTLTTSAARLCEADMASISRQEGSGFYHVTNHNFAPDWIDFTKDFRMEFRARQHCRPRSAGGQAVQVADVLADPEYVYLEPQKKSGYRTFLGVPMLRQGHPIGVLSLCRRTVQPFSDKQIELVSTFADQAVIAIENVRLFDEVQARTQELSELLEQQTATSEVLSVISSSAGDLAPVFDAMLGKAMDLCGADFGVLNTFDGERFHTAATRGLPPSYDEYRRSQPLDYGPDTAPARLLGGEPFVEIADLLESDAYRKGESTDARSSTSAVRGAFLPYRY